MKKQILTLALFLASCSTSGTSGSDIVPVVDTGLVGDSEDQGFAEPADPPTEAGPWLVAVASAEVIRGDRITPLAAHVPERNDGKPSPLVVFIPGFQLDSSFYSELAGHVASQGFVVVRADPEDPFTGISHLEMALDVTSVIDWALDPGGPLAGQVDGTAVGTAGHSLGGKVAVMTAFRDARVNALFAIDPVNGGNPFEGYNPDLPDIVPEEVAALNIPVGFSGETTNGQDADGLPACAPADQNFETFYEAATSAPWRTQWDFIGADHMDFVDDAEECGILCAFCPAGSADPEQVSAATRTLSAAFFRRHLGGEAVMERWLTGDKVPAAVIVTHAP